MAEKPTEVMVEKKIKEEDVTYCPICTPTGHECKGRLMPSEWNDDNNKEEPNKMPKKVTVMSTPSPQQYKTYKSLYFERMLNKPPPRFTSINQKMGNIIMAQEEMNQAIRRIPQWS